MKNKRFVSIGVFLIFGFVLTGCTGGSDEPYTGPKTIKITGYNLPNDVTVYEMTIFPESTGINWPPTACGNEEIDGQIITYTMVNWDDHWSNPTSWTGTGKFFIMFECDTPKEDQSKDGAHYVYSADGVNATPVDIKSEVTTLEWSKFIWHNDYTAG
jgi:hypothetical protein